MCVYIWVAGGEGGVWGKIEETTYIMTLLALSLIEFSSLAIMVSLGVIPVVPGGGSIGGRGEQRAGLWPVYPVLRIHSAKEDSSAAV